MSAEINYQETIEGLQKEVVRLNADLAFARDDAGQQAMKAKLFETSLTDEIATQIFAELVATGGGNVSPEMAKKAFRAAAEYLSVRQHFVK